MGVVLSITDDEHSSLTQLSRSQAAPAVEVARAKILLAVAAGCDFQQAARSAGRRSGDAVSHLVARFNTLERGADAVRVGREACGPSSSAARASPPAGWLGGLHPDATPEGFEPELWPHATRMTH